MRKASVGGSALSPKSQAITAPITISFQFDVHISNMASSLDNKNTTIVVRLSRDASSAQERLVTLAGQADLSDNLVINYAASAITYLDAIETCISSINTREDAQADTANADVLQEAAAAATGHATTMAMEEQEQLNTRITSLENDLLASKREEERLVGAIKSLEDGHAEELSRVEEEKNVAIQDAPTGAKHAEQEEGEEDRPQVDANADANTDAERAKAGSAVEVVEYASKTTAGVTTTADKHAEEEGGEELSGDAQEAEANAEKTMPRTSPRLSAQRELAEHKARFMASIVSIGKTGNRPMAAANESTAGADTASSPSDNNDLPSPRPLAAANESTAGADASSPSDNNDLPSPRPLAAANESTAGADTASSPSDNNDLPSPVAASADVEMASGFSDIFAMERAVLLSGIQGLIFVRLQDVLREDDIEDIDGVPIGDRNRPVVYRPGWRRYPKDYVRTRGPSRGTWYRRTYNFICPTILQSGQNAGNLTEYVLVLNTKPKVELFELLEIKANGNTAAALTVFLPQYRLILDKKALAKGKKKTKKRRRETLRPSTPIHIPATAVAEATGAEATGRASANVVEQPPQPASPSPINIPAVAGAGADPLGLPLLPNPQEPSTSPINIPAVAEARADPLDFLLRPLFPVPLQDELLRPLFPVPLQEPLGLPLPDSTGAGDAAASDKENYLEGSLHEADDLFDDFSNFFG